MATTGQVKVMIAANSAELKTGLDEARKTTKDFFDSVKEQVGRGSFFGEAIELAVGHGAFRAVSEVGRMYKEMGDKIIAVNQEIKNGASFADVTTSIMQGIPLLGDVYTETQKVRDAFSDAGKFAKQLDDQVKAIDFNENFLHHLLEISHKDQEKGDQALKKSKEDLDIAQTPKENQAALKEQFEYYDKLKALQDQDVKYGQQIADAKLTYDKQIADATTTMYSAHTWEEYQTAKEQILTLQNQQKVAIGAAMQEHKANLDQQQATENEHKAHQIDMAREVATEKAKAAEEASAKAKETLDRTHAEAIRKAAELAKHNEEMAAESDRKMAETSKKLYDEMHKDRAHQDERSTDLPAIIARHGTPIPTVPHGGAAHTQHNQVQDAIKVAVEKTAKEIAAVATEFAKGISIRDLATLASFV